MKAWLWLALPALALGACHKTQTSAGGGGGGGGGTGEAPAGDANAPIVLETPAPVVTPAPVIHAPAYLTKASANHLFEIETSRAILKTTAKADMRAYAETVLHDHEEAAQRLQQAAQAAGMTLPPPTLPSDRQAQLHGLQTSSGIAADHLYYDDQRSAQVEALAIHKSYAVDGDNVPLRAAAAQSANIAQRHLAALGRVKRD